jgi:heme ABC exporter ATP-binding subunit CcmA
MGGRWVLRDVGLTVRPGEIVAISGRNGSGKSTLLRVLATLRRADGGTLRLFGMDPRRDGAAARRRIGFAGHEPCLYGGLSVEENLRLFATLHGAEAVTLEAYMVGSSLHRRRGELVRDLSRGWQQRTALVRAIAHHPALLLLDEPFTGLDDEGTAWLLRALGEHQSRGGGAVVTTHRPDEVAGVCNIFVRLQEGRLAKEADCVSPRAVDPSAPGKGC